MEPLIGDMPLIGALSLFFLRKPVSTFMSVSTRFIVLMTVARNDGARIKQQKERMWEIATIWLNFPRKKVDKFYEC